MLHPSWPGLRRELVGIHFGTSTGPLAPSGSALSLPRTKATSSPSSASPGRHGSTSPPSADPGRVFGQQHRGWRDVLRFVTWAGVLFGVLLTDSIISQPVHAAGGPVARGLVTYAGTTAFFWWTMHFLLAGRVPWRRLIHAAMLTALLWIGLELFSSVYFSAAIISDNRLYGTIGVVFSLLTWFIAIGAVIMLGAVAGTTWDQRKGRSGGTTTGSSGRGHDGSRPPAPATRELTTCLAEGVATRTLALPDGQVGRLMLQAISGGV